MNEWVTGAIGLLAGFALLPIAQIEWDGTLYACWPWLDSDEMAGSVVDLGSPAFQAASNAAALPYELAALDALVANSDRHSTGNVLVVSGRDDLAAGKPTGFLVDHDRTCLHQGAFGRARADEFIGDWVDGWDEHKTAWLRSSARWREGVLDWHQLDGAISRCTELGRATLREVVKMAPAAWCSNADRTRLNRFLSIRRQHLREIVKAHERRFPNLAAMS